MKKEMSYEKAVGRLNEIVAALESGEVDLEQSMKLFEEGAALSSFCYQKLSQAEQKITEFKTIEDPEKETGEQDDA